MKINALISPKGSTKMMYNKVLPEFNLNLLNMNKHRAHLADNTQARVLQNIGTQESTCGRFPSLFSE